MSKTLTEIGKDLKDANKKVQLIYAFNGTGKTRLSREFKELIAPKNEGDEIGDEEAELTRDKILYYNAFTEDLFYWDNDLTFDVGPRILIQPNSFTDWVFKDQGQDQNTIANFHRYTNDRLNPVFDAEFTEVTFSIESGDDAESGKLKISKGEESNFVWSIFYTLLEEVVGILNEPDPAKRDDNQFDELEFVFVDDPVSSLDDTHLIQLAVDLAMLIKSSESDLRFIITTHNPLFYNVLQNELNNNLFKRQPDGSQKKIYDRNKSERYRLAKNADGSFEFNVHPKGSPFAYHLLLISELRTAIKSGNAKKYHFSFMRNILEKTATFLGYSHWSKLLVKNSDGHPDPFANRILNLSSHSAHSGEEVAEIENEDKDKLSELVERLAQTFGFKRESE